MKDKMFTTEDTGITENNYASLERFVKSRDRMKKCVEQKLTKATKKRGREQTGGSTMRGFSGF